MKWENTLVGCVCIIIKYKILNLSRTNIRCWFGHKYEKTINPSVQQCKKCGRRFLIINAVYED